MSGSQIRGRFVISVTTVPRGPGRFVFGATSSRGDIPNCAEPRRWRGRPGGSRKLFNIACDCRIRGSTRRSRIRDGWFSSVTSASAPLSCKFGARHSTDSTALTCTALTCSAPDPIAPRRRSFRRDAPDVCTWAWRQAQVPARAKATRKEYLSMCVERARARPIARVCALRALRTALIITLRADRAACAACAARNDARILWRDPRAMRAV